ncbi:CsgG/HfaB family protein [Microbulbifer bruguierae]|uniref:CsgG/HfaB family protein n=1 Tax=Microbulbifer bruguierae TaxID=3029061 RepID=A0ABY8N9P9_9GAMM|nr:CsgG/HfaB family protein [Microbulbifer bruguierae]WGL15626.1 CsgG/HfaB family protein [Microbulbifer bruguierae]
MRILSLTGLLLCIALAPLHAGAAAEQVDITTTGEGPSYAAALNNALVDAIGQVNGKMMTSTKVSLTVSVSEVRNDDADYYASEGYQSQVREQTQGAIAGYRILDASETHGGWRVEVQTTVARFQASPSASRKRIVIARGEAAPDAFTILETRISGLEASQRMQQAVADALTGTRKFAVLDRNNDRVLAKELDLALSGASPVSEAARLGNTLVTDFILVGRLESLGFATRSRKMRTSDRTLVSGSGAIRYAYQLIEVATSQVFFSDTVSVSIRHQDLPPASRDSAEAISTALLNRAASAVVGKLTQQIYPIVLIARSGDQVILSEGGKSLAVGSRWRVYERGEKLFDPYTKEFSGYAERPFGTLQVTRIAPKQSYAVMLSGGDRLPDPIPARTYVLRGEIPVQKSTPKSNTPAVDDRDDDNW